MEQKRREKRGTWGIVGNREQRKEEKEEEEEECREEMGQRGKVGDREIQGQKEIFTLQYYIIISEKAVF